MVTSERLVEAVRWQLPELPAGAVVGEPAKRDTAPCIVIDCDGKDEALRPENSIDYRSMPPADVLLRILDGGSYRTGEATAVAEASPAARRRPGPWRSRFAGGIG